MLTISLIGTNTWLSPHCHRHRHRHQHIYCHDHHQVAYCVPAYLLAGLHYPDIGDLTSFYLYIGIQWWMRLAAMHNGIGTEMRTAGYMLLYLACLRALTICLATVSSSRLIKGAPVIKLSTFNIDLQDQPFLTLDHHHPPGTEQRLDSVLWSFAPQSCPATSSIRLLLGSWNNMAYSARTWKVFHWHACT